MYEAITDDIKVTVRPMFLEEQSEPAENHYVWAYHVTIENLGERTVQLVNRYWRITDELGHVQEVSGAGVIGEQPTLGPGESFEYSSGTPLGTASGIMQGHYVMQTESGETFHATIPVFSLDSPALGRLLH